MKISPEWKQYQSTYMKQLLKKIHEKNMNYFQKQLNLNENKRLKGEVEASDSAIFKKCQSKL